MVNRIRKALYLSISRVGALGLLLVFLSGCASIRPGYPSNPSAAFDQPQTTTLGKAHAEVQASRPGLSGVRVLNNGVSALMTRAALIDLAERSIDVQTYIYDADDVGLFLLDRLLAAADRGVRVRLLLDDHLIDFDDDVLMRINAHPNVELRLFNPYPQRARWTRPIQLIFNLDRLGRRMHNKLFVVDGQLGIVGGRNIGNHYFEGESETNFRDVELLFSGPAVRQAAGVFDGFWNSSAVVPAGAIDRDPGPEAGEVLEGMRQIGRNPHGSAGEYARQSDLYRQWVLAGGSMIWAKAQVIGEPPVRQAEGASKSSSEVARAMAIARQQSTGEVTYAVAYFVPGERGVRVLSDLVDRGVRVKVLTNSLASTDVLAVHAGYAPYREGLLAGGVELYEYRPDASRPRPTSSLIGVGRSRSALHAKIVVYDRKLVWVGSANFDPRSRHLNTEAGMLVESAELAERLLASVEKDVHPTRSWSLARDVQEDGRSSLVWIGERDGQSLRLFSEPDAGWMRLLGVGVLSLVPGLEDLL